MAKARAEEMRMKRSEAQITATFDPTQALSGIQPIFQASNKWLENWMAVSSELLEFGRTRLDRSLEVGKAIARSGSVDEAMELQADYARSTVREYFSEAGKIADLSTRALLDGFMAWQPAMRETTRRVTTAAA
jgi:Phasin protein